MVEVNVVDNYLEWQKNFNNTSSFMGHIRSKFEKKYHMIRLKVCVA